jgi:triacylglycerol lipase|tara:strand:+ start:20279 stop:21001 length:723 start_codon:yes stop_codon:yes gene_type:complete
MENIKRSHEMAIIAKVAYEDKAKAKAVFEAMGYSKHEFIEHNGAQCHVVWNDEEVIIGFRGTEPDEFSDIKADLNAIPKKWEAGGLVHKGFCNELDKVWTQLSLVLKKELKDRKLFITGHSLGAAMATLAASKLEKSCTCLYTYGSPKAGSRSFVKSIDVLHYRFVNNNDVVAKVPFSFLGYRHHGELRYINYYGNIRKMTKWQRVKDQFRGRWRAIKKWQMFDGAYDHGMDNYKKYLGK